MDWADSIRAIILRGWVVDEEEVVVCAAVVGWRVGRMCWRMSVMKCRSDADWHFGSIIASRLGALS